MRSPIGIAIVLSMAGSLGAQAPVPADQRQDTSLNLSAYAELLRQDVRTLKVAIITEVVGFTEEEDRAFWPIYREYDLEMSKLADERVRMIRDYAADFATITDERAASLAATALDLEARRNAAKAKCYERVKTALSPRTALRFLQVEHQLQLLIDLQIAAALPVRARRKGRTMKIHATGVAALLVVAASVSLDADRIRLRSGKVVEGMFIGGDSKNVRILLDDGIVSEVPLAEAVAVEFSSRKPPPPPAPPAAPAAPTKTAAAAPTKPPLRRPVRRSPYPRLPR